MSDDWTVDIPLRTPADRPASKDKTETRGTVLGRSALLVTEGTSIRLMVSGFPGKDEALAACPHICFGLRYMSLQTPIAVRFNLTPQDVVFSPDPREAARNISKSFGGADFGAEVHGIMQDGAPAIYPTGQKVLMLSGGEVSFTITGMGKPDQALRWIDEGAASGTELQHLPEDLDTAIELFNLAGFETSPRAAFIVHCTALEQLFKPQPVDESTRQEIESMETALTKKAADATSDEESRMFQRLKGRLGNLKRYSIASSVQEGVAGILAPHSPKQAETIIEEVRAIYSVRHDLAHAGRAELGDAPRKLQEILKKVLIVRLGVQKLDDGGAKEKWNYTA